MGYYITSQERGRKGKVSLYLHHDSMQGTPVRYIGSFPVYQI